MVEIISAIWIWFSVFLLAAATTNSFNLKDKYLNKFPYRIIIISYFEKIKLKFDSLKSKIKDRINLGFNGDSLGQYETDHFLADKPMAPPDNLFERQWSDASGYASQKGV